MDELTTFNINKLLTNNDNGFSDISNIADNHGMTCFSLFEMTINYDNDFSIEFATQGIKYFGYDSENINSKRITLSDLLPKEEFDYFYKMFERNSSHSDDFLCKLKLYNSSRDLRDIYAHFVFNQSSIKKTLSCFIVDITDEVLNKSNLKRIFSIINCDDMAVVEHSLSNNKLELLYSSESISYYGFDSISLINGKDNFFHNLNNEDYERYMKQLEKEIAKKHSYFAGTYRLVSPNNKSIWVLVQSVIFYNNNKATHIDSIIHNLSEQKTNLEQLHDNQRKIENNLKHTRFISDILKHLQKTDDYKTSIKTIIKKLVEFLNISKINLIIPYGSSKNYITYDYSNGKNNFKQRVVNVDDFKNKFPNILSRLDNYGTAYCDKFSSSKGCREEFLSVGDYAFFVYSIKLENDSNGYIVLIDKDNSRIWDNGIISIVSDITQIISSMFLRYLTQLELTTTLDTFKTVLNNIGSYVCVSTIDTEEIIFVNNKFSENFGDNCLGKHLSECFGIQRDDYNYIINRSNDLSSTSRTRYYEIYSPATKQWIDITQINIIWVDGSIVKLSTLNNITQKIEYEKLIEMQAMNDHLTGLPNRRALEKDFQALVDETLQNNTFGYILFLDLDNFKNVNDGLGHQYGDALLFSISEFLKELPYTSHYTYRFGGDEFILLVEHKYCNEINTIVDTLFNRFREKWEIIDTTYYCTMSMGIAKFPYDGINLFEILKKVDMAMYNAKKQGKNRAMYYKSKIGFDSIRNIELERYLRESVSNSCNGFMVYYQPIVNAKTKEIEGAEALLRWQCEHLGMISPAEFIPLSENLGFIIQLGEFVLKKACMQCKKMIDKGMTDFKISINLSVYQIYEPDFVDKVKEIIESSQVPYSNITFEVTESLAINDFKVTREILQKLSELGVSISLDDFGTGYSSLNNIKEMPLNTIKIDKSFIDDLIHDSSTEVFVKTIIALAHALDMKVCAEGVEEEMQYKRLVDLKTDMIQGFLFGKPISAEEFEEKFIMV